MTRERMLDEAVRRVFRRAPLFKMAFLAAGRPALVIRWFDHEHGRNWGWSLIVNEFHRIAHDESERGLRLARAM